MREKELKTKGKVVHRMTKDGLAQKNLATGEAERISKKDVDVKFGEHERDYTFTGDHRVKKTAEGRFSLRYKSHELEGEIGQSRLRYSPKEIINNLELLETVGLEESAEEIASLPELQRPQMAVKGPGLGRLRFSHMEIREEGALEEPLLNSGAAADHPFFETADGVGAGFAPPGTGSVDVGPAGGVGASFGHVRGWRLPSPKPWRQSRVWRSGAWTAKRAGRAGSQWLHHKLKEVEEDNLGLKSAHTAERTTSQINHFFTGLRRKSRKSKRERYTKLERKANLRYAKSEVARMRLERFQGRYGEVGEEAPRFRGMQKKRLQRKYSSAVRKSERAAEQFAKVSEKTAKKASNIIIVVVRKIMAFFSAVLSWIFAAVGLALSILFFAVIITILAYFVFSMYTVATSYLAEDRDIHDASLLVTQLEAQLEKQIADVPTDHRWSYIDEFRYDLDPIGHNPFVLMAWMTAKFDDFKYAEQIAFLNELHNARYDLRFEVEVEEREDEDGYTYSYYILNVILRSKTIEEIIEPEMELDTTNDLRDRYDVLMESKGNRQLVANPFDFDWTSSYSSIYGYRLDPLGSGQLQIHRGLDIPMPTGTPIRAGVTGTVTESGYNDTFGNYIVITDEKGEVQVKYAHCDRINITSGEVNAGETIIATVGNTGGSTGSHLHVEIKQNGEYLNPIYHVDWDDAAH